MRGSIDVVALRGLTGLLIFLLVPLGERVTLAKQPHIIFIVADDLVSSAQRISFIYCCIVTTDVSEDWDIKTNQRRLERLSQSHPEPDLSGRYSWAIKY